MSMPPDYPPDPNSTTTPPTSESPGGDYTVPAQFTPPPRSTPSAGGADPLVPAANSSYGAWFSAVRAVAQRSWRSTLIISAIGIAAPLAIVTLISYLMGAGGTFTFFSLFSHPGLSFVSFVGAMFIKLVLLVAASYVASVGWAAGGWALVQEAKTGQPANVNAAFQYGMKRAMRLFPWTVAAGLACVFGVFFFWVPGLFLAFAFSLFGFAAVFEHVPNPLTRSWNLVQKSIGSSLAKIGTLLGIYLVYYWIISLIVLVISLPFRIFSSGATRGFGVGFFEMIGTLVLAPGIALLMIGLLVTYGELRSQEAPTSTDSLAAELG
jgi:hypothetical protein